MRPRIFVSIASYRDTECQWTVKDLYEKARHPERVFTGICWQFVRDEDADCFQVATRPPQVRVIEVDARESRGVCWARAKIQELWQGEEYMLQIDAHSRFAEGWDEVLIAMLAACPSPRTVLSTYPASYVPPNQLGKEVIAIISAKEFDERGVLQLGSKGISPSEASATPQQSAFVGAGLVFAPAAVIREVPYDPYLYFTGEEITLAARLWTHGWDIRIPNKVTVFHEYSERPNKRRHWHDHKLWTQLSDRAARRIRHILGMEKSGDPEVLRDIERYGLGNARSLRDYEAFAGVEFGERRIGGKTRDELEAALPAAEQRARVKSRFTEIWRTNGWGSSETRSGSGATLAQTHAVRAELQALFDRLDVRVLVDAGCGELNWMSRISGGLRLYLGFDIVEELVAELRQRFAERKNHFFNAADVSADVLPGADLILCRDVLSHLSHPLVSASLENFRKSGARYLVATTFPRGKNDPIRSGGWQPIDLCAAPFNLPEPLALIPEKLQNSVKSLGVWALDRL